MIGYEERRSVYWEAIERYGDTRQILKAVEELAELTKELAVELAGGDNRDRLIDEMADATIMLEQLQLIYSANEAVQDRMDYKICRLADRL